MAPLQMQGKAVYNRPTGSNPFLVCSKLPFISSDLGIEDCFPVSVIVCFGSHSFLLKFALSLHIFGCSGKLLMLS